MDASEHQILISAARDEAYRRGYRDGLVTGWRKALLFFLKKQIMRHNADNYVTRVVVGSTGGSTATLTGDSGFMSAAGGQLDISGEAGGWKLVQLQVVGASGITSRINIVGVTVQWYGA